MDMKTDPLKYSPDIVGDYEPAHILSSIRIIMGSDIPYEFRTTCVRPIVGKTSIEKIAETINGADLFALQRFRNGRILAPAFFDGVDSPYTEEDLMSLKGIASKWVKRCIVR